VHLSNKQTIKVLMNSYPEVGRCYVMFSTSERYMVVLKFIMTLTMKTKKK